MIGVAQVMNKCGGKQGVEFTEEDEEVGAPATYVHDSVLIDQ